MTYQITSAYAAILGLVAIFLSFHVIQLRAKSGVSLLDGGNTALKERIRQHGNFTEYVPLALILMGFAEAGGATSTWLHVIGGILVVSRLIHPFGIKHDNASAPARIIGASGTQIAMLIAIGLIGWQHWG
ncbi:MAG: MAPEG family protein [Aestuariivirga sp.]